MRLMTAADVIWCRFLVQKILDIGRQHLNHGVQYEPQTDVIEAVFSLLLGN